MQNRVSRLITILIFFFSAVLITSNLAWAYPDFLRPLPNAERRGALRSADVSTTVTLREGGPIVVGSGIGRDGNPIGGVVILERGQGVVAKDGTIQFLPPKVVGYISPEAAEVVRGPLKAEPPSAEGFEAIGRAQKNTQAAEAGI